LSLRDSIEGSNTTISEAANDVPLIADDSKELSQGLKEIVSEFKLEG